MKTLMTANIVDMGEFVIKDVPYGDLKLNMYPFNTEKEFKLPYGFELWEETIKSIIKNIPLQAENNNHYLTIDSKFFTEIASQRREGVHIDGNFCADPNFYPLKTWGGITWGGIGIEKGKIISKFKSPYNINIPVGEYVSENRGGILCASSKIGCEAWKGIISRDVGNEGSYDIQHLQNKNSIILKPHRLYFMTSNTPHQSLEIPAGIRRTLIRITLNHNYDNQIFTKMMNAA